MRQDLGDTCPYLLDILAVEGGFELVSNVAAQSPPLGVLLAGNLVGA